MNKAFKPLLLALTLLASCQTNKVDSVKDFISAIKNSNNQKMNMLLADNFIYKNQNGITFNKQDFINKKDSLETFETILNIEEFDSIVKTKVRIINILDSVLDVTPKPIHHRTYKVNNGKISSIQLDSIANKDEYNKSLANKIIPFKFWLKDFYDIKLTGVNQNLKNYLAEYLKLSISDKKKFRNYEKLQGMYISKDNPFYRKLIFKGKTTVIIVDALFGMSFPTGYVLDENFIRIRTDKSDLLLEIKSNNTLVGEGFAKGIFKKK